MFRGLFNVFSSRSTVFRTGGFLPNRRICSLCRVCRRRRRCGLVVKIGWTDPRSSVVQATRAALQSDTFDHWINWSLHNLLRRTDAPQEARARGKQREREVGNQPPIRRRSSPPATPGPSSIYAIFVQRFCRSWNLKTRPKSRTSETEEYPTDEPRRHWDTKKARCRFPELFRFVYITRPFRFSAWKGIPIPSFMDEEGARTHSKCVRF